MENQEMIDMLLKYEKPILETALAYAFNIWHYGVDVTKKWETATEQSYALNQAYKKAYVDCESRYVKACTDCKLMHDVTGKERFN